MGDYKLTRTLVLATKGIHVRYRLIIWCRQDTKEFIQKKIKQRLKYITSEPIIIDKFSKILLVFSHIMVKSAPASYEDQMCLIIRSMDISHDGFSENINHYSQHTVGDI